jgi:hypothetical protein
VQVLSSVPRRVSLASLSSGSTISSVGPCWCFVVGSCALDVLLQAGSMVRKGSFSEILGDREKPKSYHSCAVTAKEPRLLVKELQRMFGENKLLLRASGASFVKGDKNKTRFDIVIYKVSSHVGVLFGDMRCPQAFLLFLF